MLPNCFYLVRLFFRMGIITLLCCAVSDGLFRKTTPTHHAPYPPRPCSAASSSSGTPAIGCTCPVCTSPHPKNRRSRCSAWLDIGGQGWQIDTGPDFRSQALREQLPRIDGVLYTHPHADHLNGIDDLRGFATSSKAAYRFTAAPPPWPTSASASTTPFSRPAATGNRPVLEARPLTNGLTLNGAPLATLPNAARPLAHHRLPHRRHRLAHRHQPHQQRAQLPALQGLDHLFYRSA